MNCNIIPYPDEVRFWKNIQVCLKQQIESSIMNEAISV
jgi:hypothetical protein